MSNGTNPSAPDFGLDLVPDIDFAVKDPTIIQNEVIADYQSAFQILTGIAKTLAPADPVRLLLLTVCAWLSQQRVIIDFTGKSNLLKYAQGAYLDNLAALYGQRALRLQASPALTTLQFTLAAPLAYNVTIPSGTQVQAPGGVIFQTDVGSAVIPSGSTTVLVPATAVTPGTAGNGFTPGQINSLINWNQPFAVLVTNTTLSAGGSDQENDDQYRFRVWLAIESFSTCGPRAAYEFWALSADPSIIQVVVHSAPEIAGEVWLYPLLTGGQLPTSDILAKVLEVCSANTRRPVTDYVSAFAPTIVPYTLNMTYYVLPDNQALLATIQAAITQAVADWILWERSYIGRDIIVDELIKRCLLAGAKRVVVTSPYPDFQDIEFFQLACHDPDVAPVINYGGLEGYGSEQLS